MARKEVLMPRMGESVMEGTILQWLKKPGDQLEEEEALIEIATDKVDTEIPAPFGGVLVELLVNEGDVVEIDTPIAVIETESEHGEVNPEKSLLSASTNSPIVEKESSKVNTPAISKEPSSIVSDRQPKPFVPTVNTTEPLQTFPGRFYSPLVLNIAKKEGLSMSVLEQIPGSGKEARVTKNDILLSLIHI